MEFNKFVPFTNNRYVLTQLGDVIDLVEVKSVVSVVDGVKLAKLDWYNGLGYYQVSLIVVCASWGINIPVEHWCKLNFLFKDGNALNTMPINIGFKINEPIECKEFPGFYHVPGFTRYVIDHHGLMINSKSGKKKTWFVTKPIPEKGIRGGYRITQIYNDRNERTNLSRHRALCLTFLECPGDPADMLVNHKNGIGGSDDIDNLEWVTPRGNVKHAYDNGLYDKKLRSVLVKVMETGEIVRYKSMIECCEATGINHNTLTKRLNNNPGKFYTNGFAYKDEDDKPWIGSIVKERINRDIIFRNVFTGEVLVVANMAIASRMTGVKSKSIWGHISDGRMKPTHGFLFRYFDGTKPQWPRYSSEELKGFAKTQSALESPQSVTTACKDIELLGSA